MQEQIKVNSLDDLRSGDILISPDVEHNIDTYYKYFQKNDLNIQYCQMIMSQSKLIISSDKCWIPINVFQVLIDCNILYVLKEKEEEKDEGVINSD